MCECANDESQDGCLCPIVMESGYNIHGAHYVNFIIKSS